MVGAIPRLGAILSKLRITHRFVQRPPAFENSAFGLLSLDLILEIAKLLPVESAACLALSCTAFYHFLHPEYWGQEKTAKDLDRNTFLALLERDLPTQVLCGDCERLHAIRSAAYYLFHRWNPYLPSSWRRPICSMQYDFFHLSEFYKWHFNPVVFRMAMKVHRQGHDPSKLLKLLTLNRKIQNQRPDDNVSAETWCRIVDDSFLVRNQTIYRIRSPSDWYSFKCIARHICPHFRTPVRAQADQDSCLVEIHDGQFSLLPTRFVAGSGLEQCKYCNTEFQLDFQRVGTLDPLLIITAWHDLGKGLSFCDPQWLKQTNCDRNGRNTSWHVTFFQPGSIAAAFEGGIPFKYESFISQEDLKRLC